MNVLYLACEPRIELSETVGHTAHILKTIRGLEDKGHMVHKIIGGERPEAQKAKSTFRKLKTRLPSTLSVMLRDAYALAHDRKLFKYCFSICRETTFDFIYERATFYHRTGQRLSQALRIPLILEVNSPVEELITFHGCTRIMTPIALYIERMTGLKADAVIVGSQGMRSYIQGKGVPNDRIFIVYPAAEDAFFITPRHRRAIRRKLGIDDKVIVGFVGSMPAYQRVDLLLQAAIEISRVSNDIHFLIIGDGKKLGDLQCLANNNSLGKWITFTGRVAREEVPEYCGAMDICVIPNATWYGSPTKLFEYAALGKAIIAPRVGPIQELIRHGENGMLTELGNPTDLADKILSLAKDPSLGTKMGMALREEIRDNHTWSKNTDKLINIVTSVRSNNNFYQGV